MDELHRMSQGRIAELRVAARLLQDGLDLYTPLVDDRGIDFLVRRDDGTVDEVQVKRVSKGRWFQVTTKEAPEVAARPRRWVICVEGGDEAWILPAQVFFVHAARSRGAQGIYTYDLDLDATKRGEREPNGTRLAAYRNAWGLLREGAR